MYKKIKQYSLTRILAIILFIAAIIWTTWCGQYFLDYYFNRWPNTMAINGYALYQIIYDMEFLILADLSIPLFTTSFILYLYSKKKTNNIHYSFNRLIIISTTISLILTIIFLPNVLSTYADYQAQRSSISSAGTISMAEILIGLLMCAIPFIHCYIITGILSYCKRCEQKKEKPFWHKIKPIAWMKKFLQILKT